MSGWIKIYRKTLTSNMYVQLNSKQRDVMMICLLLANSKKKVWQFKGESFECKNGQFVSSLHGIAKRCGSDVSVKAVRCALDKLERLDFLTTETYNTGVVVTINNWNNYQMDEDVSHKNTEDVGAIDKPTVTVRRKRSQPKVGTNTEDIDKVYEAYPSTCFKNNRRRLKSRKSDSTKIGNILKKGDMSANKLITIINKYVTSCKPTDNLKDFIPPLMKFSTFLNNIPDYSDKELGIINGKGANNEVIDSRFSLNCEITKDMLDGFEDLDRILCNKYLDGVFAGSELVEKREIIEKSFGYEYRFGSQSLNAESFELDSLR